MSATKMTRPRIARAPKDQALTMAQIQAVAPAVFSEAPDNMEVSERYAYISTISILERMMNSGFQCYEVAQQRPHKRDKDPYMKHMLRLRHESAMKYAKKIGDSIPEIILINAHNGTATFRLFGGLFRLVCTNGMMVGDMYESLIVRHTGGEETGLAVLQSSYEVIEDQFPRMVEDINLMRQVKLDVKQQIDLATAALSIRYNGGQGNMSPQQALSTRREQDNHPDAWHVMNRIQENVIEGGMETQSFMYQRRHTIRPVESVDARTRINRGLWDATVSLAQAA